MDANKQCILHLAHKKVHRMEVQTPLSSMSSTRKSPLSPTMADTNEFNDPNDSRGPTEPRELNGTREPTDPREQADPRGSTQPREATDTNQLNDADELNDPDDLDEQPLLQGSCAYAFLVGASHSDGDDMQTMVQGVYLDFVDAVGILRSERLSANENS